VGANRSAGRGWLARGVPVVAVTALAVAGAAGGGASAGAAVAAPPAPGTISTVAGGVGGPARATNVPITDPCGVSAANGLFYIADNTTVRQVDSTDRLTTPAGTGASAPLGDGGPAASASVGTCATAVDAAGNLVVADAFRIRVVAAHNGTFYGQAMTAKDIYTVAGDGSTGHTGDGGPATAAQLDNAAGVAVDGSGNLVIADQGNNVIRVVAEASGTFYGQAMTAGDIYTVAGDGTAAFGGDGGPAISAELNQPMRVTVDASGNLVFADFGNDRVRVVAGSTATFYGQAMTAGDIYTVAGHGSAAFSGDSGPATSAGLDAAGVTVDSQGNLVVADTGNNRIRVVAESTATFYGQAMTAGDIYTVAGNGTAGFKDARPALKGELNVPVGVAVDGSGNLLIADKTNQRVRVVAAASGTFYNQPMAAGSIYTVAGHANTGSVGDGGTATTAELGSPDGLLLDAAGNTLIADTAHHRIRVLAGTSGTFYGQAMTAGDIYTIVGTGAVGHFGDGGPASIATLDGPQGVAIDPSGNLLIADTKSNRVRVVAETTGTFYGQSMNAGFIYTVAGGGTAGTGNGIPATSATLGFANGVTVDGSGNLVIATSKQRVRVVAETTGTFYGQAMTAGDIYTVAGSGGTGFTGDGGPATKAHVVNPQSVTVDPQGNLVVADTGNNRIRVVAETTSTFYGQAMTAGDIYTVAGGGTGGLGDGGPATSAQLTGPWDATLDSSGNLVVADTGDSLIRVVAETTSTFYGQAMTVGDIYTVAGNGSVGFSGDGGPATSASLGGPEAVITDPASDVLISDTGNGRVREVAG
jgi:NHL repeat-containing protein